MLEISTPFIDVLPPLSQDERNALKERIKSEDGIHDPVLLSEEGEVLDGHNRYGIDPKAPTKIIKGSAKWSEAEKKAFVIKANLGRRNLSPSQIIDACKPVAIALRKEGMSETVVAKKLGLSRQWVTKWTSKEKGTNATHSNSSILDCRVKIPRAAQTTIESRINKGERAEDIAADFKVTPRWIRGIKKKLEKKRQEETDRAARKIESSESIIVTPSQDVIQCNALITDPPYGVLDEPWEPKELESYTREWATRWNVCGAWAVAIFWSQRYLWEGRKWFDESFADYQFRQLLIWHFPNSMQPRAGAWYKNSFDPVFFYVHKRLPERDITIQAETWGNGLKDLDCCVASIPQSNFNNDKEKKHPAQKPVEAMRWLVSTLTHPGEVVADPFCGSGTTGIAALQLGRRFHGIETNTEYLKLAQGRINEYGNRKD